MTFMQQRGRGRPRTRTVSPALTKETSIESIMEAELSDIGPNLVIHYVMRLRSELSNPKSSIPVNEILSKMKEIAAITRTAS